MPQEFHATFVRRQPRTEKVMSFVFRPDHPVDYIPGQFVQVIFDEQDHANKALNKYLSFSSAPGKQEFELTKKLSESDFSKRLLALQDGDRVLFKGPMGHCVLTQDMKKIGFLIGGIGITPVISILEHIVTQNWPTDVCLLYANGTSSDIAYRAEIDDWGQRKNIRVVYLLMECRPEDRGCFSGIITEPFVRAQMSDYQERQILIFGPPGMVTAMQTICEKLGIDQAKVKAENFVGY